MTICCNFKIDFENKAKDKNAENNNNILMRDYIDVNQNNKDKNLKNNNSSNNVNNNNNANEKKWERFGGRPPFSHGNEDPFENKAFNNNEIYQKKNSNKKLEDNNYMGMGAKKNISEDKKDPMVWDPPEEKINNRNQNKAVVKPRQSNAQVKPASNNNKNPAVNINPYK